MARTFLWRLKKRLYEKLVLQRDAYLGPVPAPSRWVFVVGCTNSGTTLLHDMLAQHPDVGAMPEDGHFLTDRLRTPWSVGLQRVWGTRPDLFHMTERDGSPATARKLKRQWGARFDRADRPVLIEKTPPNALRMRWLERHFENAHFIGIVRHPYAVVEGIRRKSGWPLELAARQWRMTNEIMLDDAQRVRRFLLIRYEDLTDQPAATIARLTDFIGLDSDSISTDRTSRSIGGWDTRIRNRNARSFEALSAQAKTAIHAEAAAVMARLGYDDEPAGADSPGRMVAGAAAV